MLLNVKLHANQNLMPAVCLLVAGCALAATAACGRALRPTPAVSLPAPAPVVPMVVEPGITSWSMPVTMPSTRYLNEISTTLERDSAGTVLRERVETRALVSLQGRRDTLGGFRGSGVIDSFTVRGLERALTPGVGEPSAARVVTVLPEAPLSVPFDVTLDPRALRIATRPPLANECDRAERGATAMVRDLVVRLPKTLSVGATWRDSTVGFMCRLGIPITSRSQSTYVVERAERVSGGTDLVLRKVSSTQLTGDLRSTWRTVTLAAGGQSTFLLFVDALNGTVRGAEGNGQLTVKVSDSSRRDGLGTQEIRQVTTSRIVRRP